MIVSLKLFFEPVKIDIIGASRIPGKGDYSIIENLLRLGYPGRKYTTNFRLRKFLSWRLYTAISNASIMPDVKITREASW